MKKRHIAAAALSLLLMTGCANEVGVASKIQTTEPETEPVTEAATEAATEAMTETPTEEETSGETEAATEPETEDTTRDYTQDDTPWSHPVDPDEEPWMADARYTYEVQPDGVAVYYSGNKVQILEADCEWCNVVDSPEFYLTLNDYDMDGYADLFIPSAIGTPNSVGRYYCLNTSTGRFDSCDELDEKLGGALASVGDDGLLTVHSKGSASAYEDRQYRWFSGELALVQRKVQYLGSDGELYVDIYSVMGTDEELIGREHVLLDDNNEWIGTEDVPLN
ncbi:MAG: hypothetical protein J5501_09070 [Ruminococcus sp.]|nr:hypothetical protein [Ruminococcus sp.]